jgi:hypothetical protein
MAQMKDLHQIEQSQDQQANSIMNLWFLVFGNFPLLLHLATLQQQLTPPWPEP